MITSEWPTLEHPEWATYIVGQIKSLRQLGLFVDVFSFRGRKNPLVYFKFWNKLRRDFDLNSYHILHAQFGQSGILALPSKTPLVITFHGSDLQGDLTLQGKYSLIGKLLSQISRLVSRFSAFNIVVSDHLANLLPKGLPLVVIPGGINLNQFKPLSKSKARKQLDLPEDSKIILFVADPNNPIKRFDLAQTAVNLVKNQFQDVELFVASGIPYEKIPTVMNASDVLLLTSIHEGSPTVVKEALACNLPIVSVNVGDVAKRITKIEGCVLCEDDSSQTVAAALKKVLDRNQRVNGRDSVRNLDEQQIAKQIVSIYSKVLALPEE